MKTNAAYHYNNPYPYPYSYSPLNPPSPERKYIRYPLPSPPRYHYQSNKQN
ncbi:hypothetical protein BO94DRAFT_533764, partial [Aspergillus sclerotioniger CBS 115572]